MACGTFLVYWTHCEWIIVLQALFSKGYTEAAAIQLNAGMTEGLEPNATIYEYIIRTCCENGQKEEARGVLDGMNVRTEMNVLAILKMPMEIHLEYGNLAVLKFESIKCLR